MAEVTIDKAFNVIVNEGGQAHRTGWVSWTHGGVRFLAKGVGQYVKDRGCFVIKKLADPKDWVQVESVPTVEEFKRLTGWEVTSPD